MNVSPFSFHIFDHGDQFADRYTLVTPDGNVYSFSDNPYHPCGVGLYSHNCDGEHSEYTWEGKKLYVMEMQEDYKELILSDLSAEGQAFVKEKIKHEFWHCTDPDAGQFCKIELPEDDGGELTYHYAQWAGDSVLSDTNEMREKIDDDFFWYKKSLKYSEIEKPEKEVSAYYNSLDALKEECPEDWQQIVCECYFENNISTSTLSDEEYESRLEDMEDDLIEIENAYWDHLMDMDGKIDAQHDL